GDDEVEAFLADGGGEHPGRGQGVGATQGGVVDDDGLVGAHGQRLADALGTAGWPHADEGEGSTVRLGDLQAHLDAVTVGVIEDLVVWSEQPARSLLQLVWSGGIGNLLYARDNSHRGWDSLSWARPMVLPPRVIQSGRCPDPVGRPGRPRSPRRSGDVSVAAPTAAVRRTARRPGSRPCSPGLQSSSTA